MPRTIEHIVGTHQIAQARRDAGQPVWERKVHLADIWGNADLTFEQRRDAIVRRLRKSRWLAGRDELDPLVEVVDNLAAAEDTDEFNDWWDELYDHADHDRVWIATT